MAYEYITKHTAADQTPAASVPRAFGRKRTITGITIHWWGDPATHPKFDGVVRHLVAPSLPLASAHYVIEAGRVACLVAPANAAWHAGSAVGNATTIGLELNPRMSDGDYATAAEVIHELRAAYGDLPLVPHRSWKNTACPGGYDLARLDREARAYAPGKPAPAPTPPAPAPAPSPAPAPAPNRDLARGSTGPRVEALQRRLKASYPLYAKHLVPDGDYGPATEAVVREFQERAGLVVDGVAGARTHAALALPF